MSILNKSQNSLLVSLPPELLRLVMFPMTDPLDLLWLSYTSRTIFSLATSADWYSLASSTNTNRVTLCERTDVKDWKTVVLKDTALGVCLGSSPPSLRTTPLLTTLTSRTVRATLPSAAASDVTDFKSSPSPSLGPPRSQWLHWATNPSSPRQPSSLDEFDHRRPLRVQLSEAQHFETDKENGNVISPQWAHIKSPISSIDKDSHTGISVSMATCPKSIPSQSNGCNIKVAGECDQINPDSTFDSESLEPRQHQITMHGRIVKLYSMLEAFQSSTTTTGGIQELAHIDINTLQRKVDRFDILGPQDTGAGPAMSIKKALFYYHAGSTLAGRRTPTRLWAEERAVRHCP